MAREFARRDSCRSCPRKKKKKKQKNKPAEERQTHSAPGRDRQQCLGRPSSNPGIRRRNFKADPVYAYTNISVVELRKR